MFFRARISNIDALRAISLNPIYPYATRCDSKKNIVVTLMLAVTTEMGQYTLPYCIQLLKAVRKVTVTHF